MIIGDPREPRKGKKVLDHEIVLEKSNDNWENLKITIKSSRLGGQAKTPMDKKKLPLVLLFKKDLLSRL
jgi:hypothetical protein